MSASKPPREKRTSGFAVIEVEPDLTKHYVHRALLVEHSEYFKKALNGPWKEAQEGGVKLEDVECDTSSSRTGCTRNKFPLKRKTGPFTEEQVGRSWSLANQLARVKALALADRILAPVFQDALEKSFVQYVLDDDVLLVYEAVIFAFANLPSASPILQLLVDTQCERWKEDQDDAKNGELLLHGQLPNSFLVGVMKRFARLRGNPGQELDACDYHGHKTEEERDDCPGEFDHEGPDEDWMSDTESNSEQISA